MACLDARIEGKLQQDRGMLIVQIIVSLTVPPLPSFSERDAPSVRLGLGVLSD
jgi:hypothetical protein